MRVGLILMASGFASRFGANKLLAEVDGTPLIRRAMAAYPPGLFQCAAVVSQYPEILSLAPEAASGSIIALSWRGRKGNPCLFPREFYGELSALTGDRGGGAVIRAHPDRLLLVEAGTERELLDVDTQADLPPRE